MQVVVAADQVSARWRLVERLGLGPGQSFGVEEAFARVAHPTSAGPDVVVLVLRTTADVGQVARHVSGSPRAWVPVVALAPSAGLAAAARGAGAAVVLPEDPDGTVLAAALAEATAPALVIDLDALRETA